MKLPSNLNRENRMDPTKELYYLISFLLLSLLLILACEFLAESEEDFFRGQSGVVYLFFLLFIGRVFTLNSWAQHYKETVALLSGPFKLDKYNRVSLLSVMLDIFILSVLLVWVKIEKVSFIRLPVAGLVYVLLIGFSVLRKKKTLQGKKG